MDPTDLQGKLGTLRKRADTLQGQLGELDKYEGIDPVAAREALEKQKDWDDKNLDFNEEMQRKLKSQKEQMSTQFGEQIDAEKTRSAKLSGKLRQTLIDNEAIIAIKEAEGDVELLLPHVRSRMDVVEDGDDFKVVILNEKGEPAYDGAGDTANGKLLVKAFRERFPGAFKGAGSTGSGSKSGNGAASGGKNKTRAEFEQMGADDRMKFVKDGGQITGD